jgi:hypothetical protein
MTVTRLTHITWYVTPRLYFLRKYFALKFCLFVDRHVCEKCGKRYKSIPGLTDHQAREHETTDFNEIKNYLFKNIKTYRASSTCMQPLERKTRTEKLKSKEMIPMTVR